MSWNPGKGHQRVLTAKGIQIAAAEADHTNFQQHAGFGYYRFRDGRYLGVPGLPYYQCLHFAAFTDSAR